MTVDATMVLVFRQIGPGRVENSLGVLSSTTESGGTWAVFGGGGDGAGK